MVNALIYTVVEFVERVERIFPYFYRKLNNKDTNFLALILQVSTLYNLCNNKLYI